MKHAVSNSASEKLRPKTKRQKRPDTKSATMADFANSIDAQNLILNMQLDAPSATKPKQQFHPYIKSFFVEEASVAKGYVDTEEESEIQAFEGESENENQENEIDVVL